MNRSKALSAIMGGLLIGIPTASAAQTATYNIPAGKLSKALQEFALQGDTQVFSSSERLEGRVSSPVHGNLKPEEALRRLLRGTGLSYKRQGQIFLLSAHSEARTLPAVAAAAVRAVPQAAPVQAAPPAAEAVDDADIVVTAQRRSERLQEVPLSVTVATGEVLDSQGVRSLEDLGARQPNIRIAQAPAGDQLRIRGSGSGFNPGFEQSVATFVDGIYRGRARASRIAMFDVDRVEILRGPQTTFFGANAIAGALNITTRKATNAFAANASALYAPTDGEYNLEAGVGGPVSDTLGVRVAGRWSGMNGYLENKDAGIKGPHLNDKQARISAAWSPSADIKVDARFDIARLRDDNTFAAQLLNCPAVGMPLVGQCARTFAATEKTYPNRLTTQSQTLYGGLFNLDVEEAAITGSIDLGGVSLISSSGYLNQRSDTRGNITPFPILSPIGTKAYLPVNTLENFEQVSQELRIQSNDNGGSLSYLAGVYYERSRMDILSLTGFFFAPFGAAASPYYGAATPIAAQENLHQISRTLSGFASMTLNATDRLKLTGSLRYSHVRKSVVENTPIGSSDGDASYGSFVPGAAAAQAILSNVLGWPQASGLPRYRRDGEWMPAANITYEIAPDAMLYASYSHGFKAGGIAFTSSFGPETVDAYEAGIKAQWFNRRLTTNLALYRGDYSDLQDSQNVTTPSGSIISRISNIGKSRSQGVEFSTSFRANGNLTLQADLAYLDAKYISYPNAPCSPIQASTQAGCIQDLSGQRQAFAPEWSGSASIDYGVELSPDWRLGFGSTAYFTSDYYQQVTLSDLVKQEAALKLDLRVSLSSSDDLWKLSVIGKNVTNTLTAGFRNYTPGSVGSVTALVDRPRSIAIQLSRRW